MSTDPIERDIVPQLPPSPQIVDGPWQIRQGPSAKIAGYVWSFEVKADGVTVGTVEHWFVVTSATQPGGLSHPTHVKFSTLGDWTLLRYKEGGQDYDTGTAQVPSPPPETEQGAAVTYQRWTAWSAIVGATFSL